MSVNLFTAITVAITRVDPLLSIAEAELRQMMMAHLMRLL